MEESSKSSTTMSNKTNNEAVSQTDLTNRLYAGGSNAGENVRTNLVQRNKSMLRKKQSQPIPAWRALLMTCGPSAGMHFCLDRARHRDS